MSQPVGLSSLFPVVPIMSGTSATLLLTLIPGFWKTRVVSLVALIGWLAVGNLLIFFSTIAWRGNMDDIKIWADIIDALRYIQTQACFVAMACFGKFVYHRLQPSPRKFYDSRQRQNRIDIFLTLVLPVLWLPTRAFACVYRYRIVEDFGPANKLRITTLGTLTQYGPTFICTGVMLRFNILALFAYWRRRGDTSNSENFNIDASVRTRKLILFSFVNMILAVVVVCRLTAKAFMDYRLQPWERPQFNHISESLQLVGFLSRSDLDADYPVLMHFAKIHCIDKIGLGFYMFAWFGFSEEARKPYREAFAHISRLVDIQLPAQGTTSPMHRSRSWVKWFRKPEPHQRRSDPVARPTILGIIDSWNSNDSEPFFPLELPKILTPDSSGTTVRVGGGRKARPDTAAHRISLHKSPLPLATTHVRNLSREPSINTSARRLSYRKSGLPINYLDAPILPAVPTGNPEPCHLSYHKPPLPPGYVPSTETGISLSMAPRRHSYHKPSPPMLPGNASVPGARESNAEAADRVSSHKPPLPTLPTNATTLAANATDGTRRAFQPIQSFIPRAPCARTTDMEMTPFTTQKD